MEDITYIALRPLTIRGQRREAGELVPEATEWRTRRAYLSRGDIQMAPRSSVDQDALKRAEDAWSEYVEEKRKSESVSQEATESDAVASGDNVGGDTQETTESRSYEDLNADEVKTLINEGDLDPNEALEAELNRQDGGRKGVLQFLESLDEE